MIVELQNICKSYKNQMSGSVRDVLKNIDLTVSKGDLISVVGPSGCGKSTLLNIIGTMDNPDSGNVNFQGRIINDLNSGELAVIRNKKIGFVFQSFNLINYKNAIENVALPLYYQGFSRKDRLKKALDYLEKVGLKNWATHLPNELSGGQKQRVAIARSLVTEPKVLLADEPTGALDSKTSKEVMQLIQNINNEGKTILVVTHEEDIAKMCKRIIRLKDGVIVEDTLVSQIAAI